METKLYHILLLPVFLFGLAATGQDNIANSDIYTGKADITARQQVSLKPGFRAFKGCDVRVYIDASATYTPVVYNPGPGGAISPSSPTTSRNYIHTVALREPVSNPALVNGAERVETYDYYDGMGRFIQKVSVQGSPDKKDLVQHLAYDAFGREQYRYLPYEASAATGAFAGDAATACVSFYSSGFAGHAADGNPKTETLYEPSPLNRVTGIRNPGSAWADKPTAISYQTNTSPVTHWDETGAPTTFAANQLYVTEFTDEDGRKTREYKDKLGQVVLKEAYDGTNWLKTRYVYDDFGLLRIVVPPLASGPDDAGLCYFYTYDRRKRMIVKDLPGADPVKMVYDNRDRLVLTQDGRMNGQQWLATIYDAFNRPVITALINNTANAETVRTDFENLHVNAAFSVTGDFFGYGVSMPAGYTLTKSDIQTVTWYDNYQFLSVSDFTPDDYTYRSPNLAGGTTLWNNQKGQVTGTMTRVLQNTDAVADELLVSVSYYDKYGRTVETVSDNHLGGKDVSYAAYNFVGRPEVNVLVHQVPGRPEVTLATRYDYDHQGRLLNEKVTMDGQTGITLAANAYNPLGEPVAKYLHGSESGSNFNQQIDYAYNTRGWLRAINQPGNLGDDLFALDLRYEAPDPASLTADASYSGNISQMRWQAVGQAPKGYGFSYDALNRLTAAGYGEGASYSSGTGNYNTSYGYDANGNITLLNRYRGGQAIDQLTYAYPAGSNQLFSVNDATGNPEGYYAAANPYQYDGNGNMTADPSKETAISYNHLNLPKEVDFTGNGTIGYTYSANGTKLVKTSSAGQRTDYSGPFLYENNALKCIFTSAGRMVPFDDNGNIVYKFEYSLKDHLGNTRVAFSGHDNGQPELMQVTDYYPFGMVMNQENYFANGILSNKYLYNNKELQDDEIGGVKLDWYDYGARFYDPALGRFHTVDPLSENYNFQSTYAYAANNPMKYIDFMGMGPDSANTQTNSTEDFVMQLFNGSRSSQTFTFGDSGASPYITQNTSDENGESESSSSSDGGGQINPWLYGTSGAFAIEDLYNNFGYNHTSYPTTKGVMKDFSDFAGRDMSKQAMKYFRLSKSVKTIGNIGTGIMVYQSVNNYMKGDRSILNATDGAVGLTGLTNAALLQWTAYGSAFVGPAVAYYGAIRLMIDASAGERNQIQRNILNGRPQDTMWNVYNPTLGF